MKRLTLLVATAILCISAAAQTDTTKKGNNGDTIRIGKILIVKHGKNIDGEKNSVHITMGRKNKERRQNANVSTSWWNFDIGFSNFIDKTNYTNTSTYLVNRPAYPVLAESDFKLRAGKSINVNVWVVNQRINLIKHYVNLKYGFGMELNNYRFKSTISFKESGLVPYTTNTQTTSPFIFRDSISFSKNKLAADYLTVPMMLNFVSNPSNLKKGISLSLGVSAGYLYSQRNKQKSSERGKDKNKGEYGLERFKFSYIAELGLGPIRLYGSYSPKSIFEKALDIKPYTLGFRLTNW